MKRYTPTIAIVVLLAVLAVPIWAATQDDAPPPTRDRSPVAAIAGAITTVTGIAISPLLGTGVYGAYQYFQTPEEHRASLPWFAQVSFWLPALALVGAVAVKDALGAALPPGWKKPLDILETVENKATGLVAAGAVVPFTMAAMTKMITGGELYATAPDSVVAPVGLAAGPLAAIDFSWLLNILTIPFGIALFAVVWMASHAINVLILLSPWGAIDAALKSARTALFGLVAVSSTIDPWLGVILSLVVVVFAYFIAGWSFRLTIFGSIFSWDYFTFRKGRFKVVPDRMKMFSGIKFPGLPQRTYGKLTRAEDGSFRFAYRPWMVLPERVAEMPANSDLSVGRGFLFSTVTSDGDDVLVLPPRYRTHEEELARALELANGVEPIGLLKAWSWLTGELRPKARAQPV